MVQTQLVPSSTPKVHVRSLIVKNFKSFESYEIQFTPFNILVGTNNSGKSTILQAVEASFEFLREISNSVGDRLEPDLSRTAIDTSYFHVSDVQDVWMNRKYRGPGNHPLPVTFDMELSDGFRCKFDLNLYYRQPHLRLTQYSSQLTAAELEHIVSKRPILIPGFVGLLTREEFRTPARRNQIIGDGRHTEVLRNVLLEIKSAHPDRFLSLDSIIDRYFGVHLSNISFSQENDQFITADYRQASAELDLVSGGSGFLQILQLLTFFYFVNPDIVLLDEPDAHLHSSLQKVLLELLQEISRSQGIQFIIATHSKELINNADPESIVTILSVENKAQRLSSYTSVLETLKGIGAIDNVDVALLVKNKKCLFVEDNTQAEVLKRISRVLNKKLFEGDSQLVVVVRGGARVTRYYDDLPMLRQFLGTQIHSLSVMDGDYATDVMKREITIDSENKGVALHILKKAEIENYLLNPSLMSRVATTRSNFRGGPPVSVEEMTSILEQALDATKLSMTDQIAQQFSNWHRWKNDPISLSTANEKARQYVDTKWSTIDDRMTICQGKDVLAYVNTVLQSKYQVSLSIPALLVEMTLAEVDRVERACQQNRGSMEFLGRPLPCVVRPVAATKKWCEQAEPQRLPLVSENCAGLDPLGNLVAPENQLA